MKKDMMKKIITAVSAGILACALTACSGAGAAAAQAPETTAAGEMTAAGETTAAPGTTAAGETIAAGETAAAGDAAASSQTGTAEAAEGLGNSLVVYFSWSGNTKSVAEEIGRQTGAELFELAPETPYSNDYDTVLDEAKTEQSEDARPGIMGTINGFENYNVIFVGYPNWWGDAPMIIYSFLDDYDLSGKTIIPFCTSGGSGFSDSLNTIRSMEPEAEMLDGLSLGSSEAGNPEGAVSEWLSQLGFAGV